MKIIATSVAQPAGKSSCKNCFQFQNCLWGEYLTEQLPEFERLITHKRPFGRGQHVVMAGQKSEGLCLVRSGCLKAYTVNKEGESQVIGFYMPGELVCIDDLCNGIYPYNVEALDTSSVCIIPLEALFRLSSLYPTVIQKVLEKLSYNMRREHEQMFVLTKMNAKQRLAAFLIDISDRMERCHQADDGELNISMRRSDIANFLGMATETVSRWMSRFQNEGIIRVNRRHITIKDMQKLKLVMNCAESSIELPLEKTA
ncbi:Crp/Fnr family transcriptional regulator [Exilibacterium tricleocarpae]|nr:helix-turn-helix domain-containing protein [Exilibacterium tricleocarpae]